MENGVTLFYYIYDMERKKYNKTYIHYDNMMDAHKMTGRLFGVIPFYFNVEKYTMLLFMAIVIVLIQFIFSFGIVGLSIIIALLVLFNTEYNRVYDIREKIVLDCIWIQMIFEDEIDRGISQLPDAPDYIDDIDINVIFEEAIYNHEKTSHHIFNRVFNKMIEIFK